MDNVKNIIVIGPTAAGKSYLLNLLLGIDPQEDEQIIFKISDGNTSCTQKGQCQAGSLYNKNKIKLKLLDLPGLKDTQDSEVLKKGDKPKSIEHLEKMQGEVETHFNYKIDRILYCIDAQRPWDKDQQNIIQIVKKFMNDHQKVSIVITKINTLFQKQRQKKMLEWRKTLNNCSYESVYFFGADLNEIDENFEHDLEKSSPVQIKMWKDLSNSEKKEICGFFDYIPPNNWCQLI